MENHSHKQVLKSLQAGRAIAALLVVLYHNGTYIFALDKYWDHNPVGRLFDFGHAGVDFFFVLSGFIIMHIHWPDIGQPRRLMPYAKKRFLRIYPVYWLVLAAIIPIYFLVPSFGVPFHREFTTILSSITLVYLDNSMHTELAVGWTLYHEVLFYAFFALAIFNKRIGMILMGLWMLSSLYSLTLAEPLPAPLGYLTSPLHLLFAMGMLACQIARHYRISTPGVLAVAGIALFFITGLEENYVGYLSENIRNLCFGFSSALALIGLVTLERLGRLRVPSLLVLTGNASYVIYLTHFTLLSLLAKIFTRTGLHTLLPDWLCYILLPLLAVAMGIGAHLLVERPLLRWLSRAPATTRMAPSGTA